MAEHMHVASQMRGTVSAHSPWDVMVDLFFYREPEETKEEGEGADPYVQESGYGGAGLPAPQGMQRWQLVNLVDPNMRI